MIEFILFVRTKSKLLDYILHRNVNNSHYKIIVLSIAK